MKVKVYSNMRRFSQLLVFVFLFSTSCCWHQPVEKLNWQTFNINEASVSIDLPYPLDVKITKNDNTANKPAVIIFGHSKNPYDYSFSSFLKEELKKIVGLKLKPVFFDFNAFIHYEKAGNKGRKYKLSEIVNRWINSFYKIYTTGNKNIFLKKEPFQRSGLSGVIVTDSCDCYDGKRFEYTHHSIFIYVPNGREMWQIYINYATKDDTADSELALSAVNRIIKSIKIGSK